MGVTAMILGILGMFFGLPVAFFVPFIGMFNLLAILAIIFGAVQIKNIKRDPANYGGGGMAKAGLIMGIIVLAISIAVSLAFVGLFGALMAGA